jgi:hypothetical protein
MAEILSENYFSRPDDEQGDAPWAAQPLYAEVVLGVPRPRWHSVAVSSGEGNRWVYISHSRNIDIHSLDDIKPDPLHSDDGMFGFRDEYDELGSRKRSYEKNLITRPPARCAPDLISAIQTNGG